MTQPSQPQPASTLLEPRYSYTQLHLEAETIVVGAYGIGAVYHVLKEIRDDERKPLLAAIAERDARIATLEAQLAESQRLYAECTTSLITADRQIERLRGQLAAVQVWTPVLDGEYQWGEDGVVLKVQDEGYRVALIDYRYDEIDALWMDKGYALCRRAPAEKGGDDAE